MRILPVQTVSYSEKVKDDYQWAKDTIDFLCSVADDQIGDETQERKQMLSNYQLYNNIINQEDFERECNPLGIEIGQFKDEIHPYNKTYNKIQVLLGEELRRKIDYRAVIVNQEGIKKKELKRTELMRAFYEAEINKEVERIMKRLQRGNPPPEPTGNEEQDQKVMQDYQQQMQAKVDKIMSPDEIEKYMSTEYQEAREIMVQKILNYLIREQEIQDIRNEAFKHACISAREFMYVGIRNGTPYVEVLNPLKTFYNKSTEVKYVQKGEYAGYRTRMTGTDILKYYGAYLEEEDKKKFQGEYKGIFGIRKDLVNKKMTYYNRDIEFEYNKGGIPSEGSYGESEGFDWEVTHVEWVSQAKVGFYYYFDEDGEQAVKLVSETFKMPANARKVKVDDPHLKGVEKYEINENEFIEWHWIPEVWEGVRIGSYEDECYVKIGKKEVQFRSIDNPWEVSLGYHGIVYNSMNAKPVSIMDRMKPYQYLYFIVMHKLKKLIARDKGPAFPIDVTMIDSKIGLEKTLYYLEHLDYDFYNPLENGDMPGVAQRGKITGAVQRSSMQQIMNYIELLRQLDLEIGDAAGVTKQREGGIGTHERVGNAQQSIAQSSHITEKYFFEHMKLWEKVMSSLVQCAQVAWKDKRVLKQYALDDMSRQILDFDGEEIFNADFSIFVSNSMYDSDLIDTLKQMAVPILQNEGKLTDIIKIYKAMSSSELEREFKHEEQMREKRQQQAEEAQRQMQEQMVKMQLEAEQRKMEHEENMLHLEWQYKLKEAEIEVFKFQRDLDVNNNNIPDPLELERLRTERDYNTRKLEVEQKMHEEKMEVEKAKIKASKNKSK